MKLPNGKNAVVEPRKLLDYSLNLNHPIGGNHAVLFRDLLGITIANWTVLRDALLQAAQNEDVIQGQPSPYGQKFEMRFSLTGPTGAKMVLAVWLLEHGDPLPRLITTYEGIMATPLPKEHDLVALLVDLPDLNLSAGDTGAVVHCYRQGDAFEVEFLDAVGKPRALATLKANQILKLNWAPAATN